MIGLLGMIIGLFAQISTNGGTQPLVLYTIAKGKTGFDLEGGFASNGYGARSPGG